MDRVTVAQWLDDLKADELVKMIMLVLAATIVEFPLQQAQHVSVQGMFGFCGLTSVREGEPSSSTLMPARAVCADRHEIERRGGTVWRGRRVANVLTKAAGRAVS